MNFESFVTERLADLTSKYNALVVNAKRIFELPVQNNLDPTSLIHVSRDQVSESLSVQKIIDAVAAGDYDHLISIDEITVLGTDVTFPANAEWLISNTYYQNIADIERPIALAASGLNRIDIAVANTSNDIVIESGEETSGIAVRPNIPVGTVLVTQINVTDSLIEVTPPLLGTEYVKKLESQDFIANYGATLVLNQIDLIDDRNSISLIGSATDVKSVQLSGLFIRPGKPHFFKNRTGHDVKLWHMAGTGNIKYFFANGLDLIVKNGEVIQFNTNANDSAYVRFEYVGGATSVTGAMTYKGSVANFAALPSTGVIIGDVYNLTDTGHNYAWSGSVWDDLGPAVDISGKENAVNKVTTMTGNTTSNVVFLTAKAVYDWVVPLLALKQDKDSQVEISANSNVLNAWDGQTVLFTASCTITVPSTLNNSLMFAFRTLAGVTITWAITAPFTWETTPTTTLEKTVGSFIRRGATNTIMLDI